MHAGEEVAEAGSGGEDQQAGAAGRKGEGPVGWEAQPEALVDSVACYVGGYPAAPSCYWHPSTSREADRSHLLRRPLTLGRTPGSGWTSPLALGLCTGRTEREGVVTTMPSPQVLHRGGGVLWSTHILSTGAFLVGALGHWELS